MQGQETSQQVNCGFSFISDMCLQPCIQPCCRRNEILHSLPPATFEGHAPLTIAVYMQQVQMQICKELMPNAGLPLQSWMVFSNAPAQIKPWQCDHEQLPPSPTCRNRLEQFHGKSMAHDVTSKHVQCLAELTRQT